MEKNDKCETCLNLRKTGKSMLRKNRVVIKLEYLVFPKLKLKYQKKGEKNKTRKKTMKNILFMMIVGS
jgi:hypothetical protein